MSDALPSHPIRQIDFARMLGKGSSYIGNMIRDGRLKAPAVTQSRQIVVAEAIRQLGIPVSALNIGAAKGPGTDLPALTYAEAGMDRDLIRERDEANVQLKQFQARKAELDVAEAEGRLVDADEVRRTVEARTVGLRLRLMAAVVEVSPALARIRDPVEVERRLSEVVEGVLTADASQEDGE
jgi:hypothetical protein